MTTEIVKSVITVSSTLPYIDVDFYRDDGSVESKRSPLDGFYENLYLAIHPEQKNKAVKLAPGNLFPASLFSYRPSKKSDTFKAYFYVPAGKKAFNLFGIKTMIPFPALVFETEIEKGRETNSLVFAVKDKELSESTILYQYPFGNVYENGDICFGGNEINDISSPADALRVVSMFFGCETNNDLWSLDERVCGDGLAVRTQLGLVDAIKGKTEYPESWLVRTNDNISCILND